MAGSLKLDEAGVSGLARALASHGASASGDATGASRALRAAEAGVRTPQLTCAIARFTAGITGRPDRVGDHVTFLGATADAAARAVLATDARLAADAPRPGPPSGLR